MYWDENWSLLLSFLCDASLKSIIVIFSRPDWEKSADVISGGVVRWKELSDGKSSNDLVDVLLAEIQAGGPVDSGGAEYFDGQVLLNFRYAHEFTYDFLFKKLYMHCTLNIMIIILPRDHKIENNCYQCPGRILSVTVFFSCSILICFPIRELDHLFQNT